MERRKLVENETDKGSGNPVLELRGITRAYSAGHAAPEPVLRGVDLSVAPGELIAIVGPSGSGKSTLLNIAGSLDVPDSGEVYFDGVPLAGLSENKRADLRNQQIGFVFQLHHLLPQCTVLENVLVPAIVGGQAGALEGRALELIEQVGLTDRIGQLPGRLSGGECQRVAAIRALINSPRVVLADEPTGSLDRAGARGLMELLVEMNEKNGTAFIVVTHSDALAQRAGRVLELRDGRLHAT